MALASGETLARYSVQGVDYEVDVAQMVQTNLATGERWMIEVAPEAAPEVKEPEPFVGGASEPREVPSATSKRCGGGVGKLDARVA